MNSFQLCALQKDRKAILERLQVKGAVETKTAEAGEGFFKLDSRAEYTDFLDNADKISKALEILGKAAPKKKPLLSFLEGKREASFSTMEEAAEQAEASLRKAFTVNRLKSEIDAMENEILLNESQESLLSSWLSFPESEGYGGTKRTSAFIGSISGERTAEEILGLLSSSVSEERLGAIHAEVVFSRPEHTNFFVVSLKEDSAAVEEALRQIGFSRAQAPDGLTPAERKRGLRARRDALSAALSEKRRALSSLAPLAEEFERLQDYYSMRAEKYQVLEQLALSEHAFLLEGYVLEDEAQAIKEELERDFVSSIQIGPPGEDAPVALKNNSFSGALEGVLESYSLPAPGEFDPTFAMSVFYYLMFGLMFSDAGYGFLMAAVCGFLLAKYKRMGENWRKSLTMFFWCGVSTVFWGVVFSSYFGDVVNVASKTFLGAEVAIPPLWFIPTEDPMRLLIFCLALGIAHLTFGYLLKGYKRVKEGAYLDAVWDSALPIIVLYPLLAVLVGTDMFFGMAGFKASLSPSANMLCLGVSGAAMAGVALTAGRESKSWVKRLLKGIYGLYNILAGWLSDILSYSRLLALGLATGVIASIMNQLGAMGGKSPFGIILFVIVFVAGQAINFGINVLGAYVHSNRLAYVEFFGKFYDGGGRKFKPFGAHTKYLRIEEGK
jgi:V/A-type H+-transporting ATPase subunit I